MLFMPSDMEVEGHIVCCSETKTVSADFHPRNTPVTKGDMPRMLRLKGQFFHEPGTGPVGGWIGTYASACEEIAAEFATTLGTRSHHDTIHDLSGTDFYLTACRRQTGFEETSRCIRYLQASMD